MAEPAVDRSHVADVAVVGGGLAGLSAARHVYRANRRVVVLEARGEVGGRTRSRPLGGNVADFGGEWIGRAHRRARALAREFGLRVEPAHNLGYPIRWRLPSGVVDGRLPPRGMRRDLVRLLFTAGRLAAKLSTSAPWEMSRAHELDARSTGEWVRELGVGSETYYILERLIGSLCSQRLERFSLLHFLWWMRLAGGPLRTLHTTFQWRLPSGTQELSIRMAAELGGAVHLDSPARRVGQNGNHVIVEVEDGRHYVASGAIIAAPVPYVERIEFAPPLPDRQRMLSRLHVGAGTKILALLPHGHEVRHNTVIGGERLWAGWRSGDRVTGFAAPPECDLPFEELCTDLAESFGVRPDDLRQPTVFRWADEEHIPGCDVAFAPSEVCRYGPWLTRPHDRVCFAGAERSSWPNNMEGAIESGERAAHQVLTRIQ